jgi:tetratricopeptide (TPR) repeat protein
VRLWEASTGEAVGVLEGHADWVNSVAFSPDGQYIASGGGWEDNTVRLWEASTGQAVRVLEGHSGTVWSVAFSPDGQYIASGSGDDTVRLWEANIEDLLKLADALIQRDPPVFDGTERIRFGFAGPSRHESSLADRQELEGLRNRLFARQTLAAAQRRAKLGQVLTATRLFSSALLFDPTLTLNPELEARVWAASGLLEQGQTSAHQGQVLTATRFYSQALALNPNLWLSAPVLNSFCRLGARSGQVAEVTEACNQAVNLAPQNGDYYDSRGLARTLSGDYEGAIEDFETYVAYYQYWDSYAEEIAKRKAWIETLKAGQNPFTSAMLEMIR